jgi:hypothetical protein
MSLAAPPTFFDAPTSAVMLQLMLLLLQLLLLA